MKKRSRGGDPLYYAKKEIIDRLVEPKYDIGLEIKTINKLIEKYPIDFLSTVRLYFKVKSLLWFIGGGKTRLEEFYKVWLSRNSLILEREEVKIEENKIGEDKPAKKAKTLKAFLNEKKEN